MTDNKAARILNDPIRADALKDLAKVFADWMLEMGMFTSCINCGYWDDKKELCTKFKQRPPAKIIVKGCDSHMDIPF